MLLKKGFTFPILFFFNEKYLLQKASEKTLKVLKDL
jgi:hypothetical protein